jgi:hypothetical protein
MADFYHFELVGARNALLNFEQLPDAAKRILHEKITQWTDVAEGLVRDNIQSRLQTKSGRLLAGLKSNVREAGYRVEGTVYIEGVPYSRLQDIGGTISAHMIRPKNSPVLRFMMNGKKVYAQYVFHPGAHIPGVRYMKDAFSSVGPQLSRDIKTGIVQGIREHMRNGR